MELVLAARLLLPRHVEKCTNWKHEIMKQVFSWTSSLSKLSVTAKLPAQQHEEQRCSKKGMHELVTCDFDQSWRSWSSLKFRVTARAHARKPTQCDCS
jgi:hypothetical protein